MIQRQFKSYAAEDAPSGDITTQAVLGRQTPDRCAVVRAKEHLVMSGCEWSRQLIRFCFPQLRLKLLARDGQVLTIGSKLMTLQGPEHMILTAERVLLNGLQHLCGVATQTAAFVKRCSSLPVKVYDTRKTLPGWRVWQKQAVIHGGGYNHRFSLSDHYMIKNNHVDAAGSIATAIERVLTHRKTASKRAAQVFVEVRSASEFSTAMQYPVHVIVFDNFRTRQLAALIRPFVHVKKRPLFEASGGIDLDTVRHYAKTGVDRISIGALTHSVRAIDLHLRWEHT